MRWIASISMAILAVHAISSARAVSQSCNGGPVTVTGQVRGFAVSQMEPQEEPQSSFFLDATNFTCTQASVLVMAPGRQFCMDGDEAVVSGDYLPPDGVTNIPIIDGARVTCSKSHDAASPQPQPTIPSLEP
jgi:hypothetical protein